MHAVELAAARTVADLEVASFDHTPRFYHQHQSDYVLFLPIVPPCSPGGQGSVAAIQGTVACRYEERLVRVVVRVDSARVVSVEHDNQKQHNEL